jgi:hypothetical protein
MNYHDGTTVKLGDIVAIPMPAGPARARVVWLGDTGEHLDLDAGFVEWVGGEKLIDSSQIVVEWVDGNPLANSGSQYAPVGNYLFTGLCCVTRIDD